MSNWPDLEFVCSTNNGSVFAAEFAKQMLSFERKGFEEIEVTSSGLLADVINNLSPHIQQFPLSRVLPYLKEAREIGLISIKKYEQIESGVDLEKFVRKSHERIQEYIIRATEEFNVCCIKDYKPRQIRPPSNKNPRIIWTMSSQQADSVRMIYSGQQQPLVLILKDEKGSEIQDPLFAQNYGQYHSIIKLLNESVSKQIREFISYGPRPMINDLPRGCEYL
jgi:protein-tyrosine-phosphatase